jgi:peptidyl-prolyl cis-trans isomerase C
MLQQAWYLVKLEDKKSSKPASFEQAEQSVKANLAQKKQLDLLSKIAKDSAIVIK